MNNDNETNNFRVTNEHRLAAKCMLFFQAGIMLFILLAPYWEPLMGLRMTIAHNKFPWMLLLILSTLFFISSLINLGSSTTPNPIPKARGQVVTTGLYAYCRHPMYAGILGASFAWSGYALSWLALAGTGLLYLLLSKKARFEEQLLREQYGYAYQKYADEVGRFFPRRPKLRLK